MPLKTKELRDFFFLTLQLCGPSKTLGGGGGALEGFGGLFSKSRGHPGALSFAFLFLLPWSFLYLRMLKRKKTI